MAAKRPIYIRTTRRKSSAKSAAGTNSCLSLTWEELHDLQRKVLKDLRSRDVPNLVGVGVGRKNPFRKRAGDLALIFVVSRCVKKGLRAHQKLGKRKRFEVCIGKGKRARWVNLASDVIPAKSLHAVPVAAEIAYGADFGTAGLVLRWTEGGSRRWGVLTAAHVVSAAGAPPLILLTAGGTQVNGVSIQFLPSAQSTPFDAAVLRIKRADVTLLNSTLDPDGAPMVPDNSIDFELSTDDGVCRTLLSGDISIDIQAAFGQVSVAGWPKLISLLGFKSNDTGINMPFKGGNSGSAVRLASGAPLGMLVAAIPNGFNIGYTQPLSEVLDHLRAQMRVSTLDVLGFC
jgi:hypothetical protein